MSKENRSNLKFKILILSLVTILIYGIGCDQKAPDLVVNKDVVQDSIRNIEGVWELKEDTTRSLAKSSRLYFGKNDAVTTYALMQFSDTSGSEIDSIQFNFDLGDQLWKDERDTVEVEYRLSLLNSWPSSPKDFNRDDYTVSTLVEESAELLENSLSSVVKDVSGVQGMNDFKILLEVKETSQSGPIQEIYSKESDDGESPKLIINENDTTKLIEDFTAFDYHKESDSKVRLSKGRDSLISVPIDIGQIGSLKDENVIANLILHSDSMDRYNKNMELELYSERWDLGRNARRNNNNCDFNINKVVNKAIQNDENRIDIDIRMYRDTPDISSIYFDDKTFELQIFTIK